MSSTKYVRQFVRCTVYTGRVDSDESRHEAQIKLFGKPTLKDIRRSHQISSIKLHKTNSALDTQERGGGARGGKRIQHQNEKGWESREKHYIITGKHDKVKKK